MSKLLMIMPTLGFGKSAANHESWGEVDRLIVQGIKPLTAAYQKGYEEAPPEFDILGFVHDDVTVYDPDWKARVLSEFEDPGVGLVGFGGSTGHGNAQIYQIPYSWEQVGREGQFMSNLVNAELHGMRITDVREASVLDGFAMFVRREVLDDAEWSGYGGRCHAFMDGVVYSSGGWPQGTPVAYWAYDYWISCETRRQGERVRVVGVSCEHTCPPEFREYVVNEDCQAAHKWLYDNYRDTFPARVV